MNQQPTPWQPRYCPSLTVPSLLSPFSSNPLLNGLPLGLSPPFGVSSVSALDVSILAGTFFLTTFSFTAVSAAFFAARSSALLVLLGAITNGRTGALCAERVEAGRGGRGRERTEQERGRSGSLDCRRRVVRVRRGVMVGGREEATGMESRRRWPGTGDTKVSRACEEGRKRRTSFERRWDARGPSRRSFETCSQHSGLGHARLDSRSRTRRDLNRFPPLPLPSLLDQPHQRRPPHRRTLRPRAQRRRLGPPRRNLRWRHRLDDDTLPPLRSLAPERRRAVHPLERRRDLDPRAQSGDFGHPDLDLRPRGTSDLNALAPLEPRRVLEHGVRIPLRCSSSFAADLRDGRR